MIALFGWLSVGLVAWLFTYGLNRIWLMYKGLFS